MIQEYHIVFNASPYLGTVEAIEETILGLHPDELPEIIAVSINTSLPDYLGLCPFPVVNDYLDKESVTSCSEKGFHRRYRSVLSGLTA